MDRPSVPGSGFPRPRPAASVFAVLCWLLAGLAATPGDAVAQSGSRYRIGPRDRVQLRVVELPDLSGEVEVRDDGTIELAVIGEVVAQGLTEDELEVSIRSLLEAQGLRRATVSAKVTAFLSRPVTVLGAVREPGNHSIPGQAPLLEILMQAGGPSAEHDRWIEVRRRAENGLADRVRIDIDDLITRGDPAVNIPIFAGDVIHLPEARPVRIHFVGKVASGQEEFSNTERVTLLTAVAKIGGLPAEASKKIKIVRHRDTASEEVFVVHYGRILERKEPDFELEDGDLVIIKESFF